MDRTNLALARSSSSEEFHNFLWCLKKWLERMQNHDSSTKMLPNFIELFYVTIIAFLDVQKFTQEDHIKQSKSGITRVEITTKVSNSKLR